MGKLFVGTQALNTIQFKTKLMPQQELFTYDKDRGYVCPCCSQFVKRYRRTFNSNMALSLIALFKYADGKFVHLEDLMTKNGYKRCGDASYLVHYGLIEALKQKRDDGSKRNGHYRITDNGEAFVKGNFKVQSKFLMFNNKCEGFTGAYVNVQQALGKKFDYNQLMNNHLLSN